jgi:hypothetical protein
MCKSMTKPSPFLQLPRELRDMIHAYTVVPDSVDPNACDVLIGFWGNRSTTRPGMHSQLISCVLTGCTNGFEVFYLLSVQ